MHNSLETSEKCIPPPQVDIITGGFPCQNISVAGNNLGIIGEQSRLWFEYLRIIHEVQPRYIIIENSSQLRNKGLEFILFDLSKIGYDAQWECLRAFEFGFPHQRERLFVVAYPSKIRWRQERHVQLFQSIDEILGKPYRQVVLPVPIKRIHPKSNHADIPGHYGLSRGLDRDKISAIGDAVLPDIAEYIFKCILLFEKKLFDYA